MKSPKAPLPPDPMATAQAQSGMNRDTAMASQFANMVDQRTPYGSLSYSPTGKFYTYVDSTGRTINTPQYQAIQRLSTDEKRINKINNQTERNIAQIGLDQSQRIGGILGTPLSFDSVKPAMDWESIQNPSLERVGTTDYSADRQKVEDALMARMQPKLDADRSALESRLAARGLRAGTQAFDDAMREASVAANDARYGAILNAGQEQSRLLDMEIAGRGFNNQASQQRFANDVTRYGLSQDQRQRSMQEMLTERNQPINEISALLNGAQVSQPNWINTPQTQVAGVDYAGMVRDNYNAQMDVYKQKVASNNAMMGGLFGLAGNVATAGIKYSDWNLKTNIRHVGYLNNGLPVYSYRYKAGGPEEIGLMAQDVEQVKPEAVATMPSGFKAVDYAQAVEG